MSRAAIALGSALFCLGLATIIGSGGTVSTRPGASADSPLPTCEGGMNQWVSCAGRVTNIQASNDGGRIVTIQPEGRASFDLFLSIDKVEFEIGNEISFSALNTGRLTDIGSVEIHQGISAICVGEATVTGRGVYTTYKVPGREGDPIHMDLALFGDVLRQPGSKALSIRGNEVVGVKNIPCTRGTILSVSAP